MKQPWVPLKIEFLRESRETDYAEGFENFLLDFFDEPQSQKQTKIAELLNNNALPWPLRYQLSEQRQHLLDWFPFESDKTLLDVGSGCGSLIGLFSDRLNQVTALELSHTRARVISQRWADKKNIRIISDTIENYSGTEKFDYVNVTGVLEYVGKYADEFSQSNFETLPELFMRNIAKITKKDGLIFLAIENPLGVRYLSGASEDHYGDLFIGVENYLTYNGIRAFSLNSLEQLLEENQFSVQDVYLPFPDYKLPSVVMSQEYLDTLNSNSLSSFIQNVEHSELPLHNFFSEVGFSSHLVNEKIMSKFSNSFLIIGKKI